MNGLRDWLGPLRNRVPGNLALAATLILFTVLLVNKLLSM